MAIQGPFRIRKYGNLETFFHHTICQFGVIFRVRKGPRRTQSTRNDLAPAPASLVAVRWVQSAGHIGRKRQTLIDEWDPAPCILQLFYNMERRSFWTLDIHSKIWQFGDILTFSGRKKLIRISIERHFQPLKKYWENANSVTVLAEEKNRLKCQFGDILTPLKKNWDKNVILETF